MKYLVLLLFINVIVIGQEVTSKNFIYNTKSIIPQARVFEVECLKVKKEHQCYMRIEYKGWNGFIPVMLNIAKLYDYELKKMMKRY